MAGAQAIYERDRDWEKVRISGPIAEDIKVYVCRHIYLYSQILLALVTCVTNKHKHFIL